MRDSERPLPDTTRIDWRETLAYWMDNAFRVPGTNIRFGLDALVGLVPGMGEWITAAVQGVLVMSVLSRRDVPRAVAARLVANVAIDSVIGAIPFLGDLFDVFFKANTRNLALVRRVEAEYQERGKVSAGPHLLYLGGVGAIILFIIGATGYTAFVLARALVDILGISGG